MADKRFTPKAQDKFQVDSITAAGVWAAADTQTSTVNEKEVVVTVGATVTTAAVATAILEALNGDEITGDATRSETGDNIPEFTEFTATLFSASVVHVTGNTRGKPFTLTSAENTAGTGTAALASVTAATGVSFWDNVDNWGGSAIPADTDVVYLDNTDVDILYGLAQGDIEPTAMYVAMSFEGDIGLPEYSDDGGYHEYRATYLRIGPAALQIGAGEGNGSGRIKIDSGDDICALTVLNTGTSADELPAFIWKGTNAGNTLVQRGGSVGVAVFGAETATLSTFTVHDGELALGAGVTLSGALVVNGGSVTIRSLIDGSLTVNGGTVLIEGTGNVDQLTVRGGTVIYNTSGTLGGATVVSGGGVLDFSRASTSVTVTNPIDVQGETARVLDPFKRTGAVVLDLNEGSSLAQIDGGINARWTRGTVA
jgi:hypothetical protein